MGSFVDISKHHPVEKKYYDSEETLRAQSRKIIESQEDERKRVAKELHDSVGGNLAAIKFALEQKLASMSNTPPDDVCSLENIIANIKDTITEVRRICNDLMPSVLIDLGLLEAIRWFCREKKNIIITSGSSLDSKSRKTIYRNNWVSPFFASYRKDFH